MSQETRSQDLSLSFSNGAGNNIAISSLRPCIASRPKKQERNGHYTIRYDITGVSVANAFAFPRELLQKQWYHYAAVSQRRR